LNLALVLMTAGAAHWLETLTAADKRTWDAFKAKFYSRYHQPEYVHFRAATAKTGRAENFRPCSTLVPTSTSEMTPGNTTLMCAAFSERTEAVKSLVEHNAQVNVLSHTTAIIEACRNEMSDIVRRYLLENGSDISVADTFCSHKRNL